MAKNKTKKTTKNKTRNKTKDIKKEIMSEIKKGEVKMRPKMFFVFGSIFLILGVVLSVGFSSIFVHRAIFRIRTFTPFSYLSMGGPGMRPFFMTFPWVSLLVSFGSIALGLFLLKKYDFSYKKNFMYFVVGLVAIVAIFTSLLLRIRFSERAQKIKGVRQFYKKELPTNIPTPPSFAPKGKVRGVRYHFR